MLSWRFDRNTWLYLPIWLLFRPWKMDSWINLQGPLELLWINLFVVAVNWPPIDWRWRLCYSIMLIGFNKSLIAVVSSTHKETDWEKSGIFLRWSSRGLLDWMNCWMKSASEVNCGILKWKMRARTISKFLYWIDECSEWSKEDGIYLQNLLKTLFALLCSVLLHNCNYLSKLICFQWIHLK